MTLRRPIRKSTASLGNGLAASAFERSFIKPAKVGGSLTASSDSELRGRRGLEGQQSPIGRVPKFQFPRMKHVAGKAAPASIERVAENGTPEVFEVNADLVRAAGSGAALD